MNLAIDIGNTRIKAGIFNHHTLLQDFTFLSIDELIENKELKNILPSVKSAIISNVADKVLVNYLKKIFFVRKIYELSIDLPLPFKIDYETPHTLGSDRLAAAAGAINEFTDENILVIDFGTCIKYNVVIDKTFCGGAISPGLEMRYKALNHYTNKLPLLQAKNSNIKNLFIVGKNTHDNLHTGVINGIIGELKFFIDKITSYYNNDLKILITGGDAIFFEPHIERKVFLRSSLILNGLNEILEYQQ